MYHILGATIAAVFALLLVAAPLRAQDIPTGESDFTSYMAERLRTAIPGVPVRTNAPLTLSVGSLQANLDRIYAYCRNNAAACTSEVDTFIKGAAEAIRGYTDAPTKEAIRVVVRSSDYVRQAKEQVGASGLAPPRPLAEGIVIVPVLDSSHTVRMVNDKDRAALGLTPNQVYEIGIANLRRTAKPLLEVAKPVGRGRIGHLGGDFYQSSRLVLVDSWAPLAQAQGGVLIVAVPATDTLLYASDDSAVALDALRTLAKDIAMRSPKPLSNILLRWTPRGWQTVR